MYIHKMLLSVRGFIGVLCKGSRCSKVFVIFIILLQGTQSSENDMLPEVNFEYYFYERSSLYDINITLQCCYFVLFTYTLL